MGFSTGLALNFTKFHVYVRNSVKVTFLVVKHTDFSAKTKFEEKKKTQTDSLPGIYGTQLRNAVTFVFNEYVRDFCELLNNYCDRKTKNLETKLYFWRSQIFLHNFKIKKKKIKNQINLEIMKKLFSDST